jgi:ribose transport system substrate-binding protein
MNANKKPTIFVSLITQENDYQREQAVVAESAGHKLGLSVKVEYADNDAVNQTLQLLRAIQAKPELRPEAIIVEPTGTSMGQVAAAAASAGIGWVLLNGTADYLAELRRKHSCPLFSVASDNDEVGRIQGKQFNLLMPRGGCMLYIEGPSASDTARRRTAAMIAIKRNDLDIKTHRGGWTETGAHNAVKSWLRLPTSKELHIGMVGCQNDAMAMGARKAFEEYPDHAERTRFLSLPFTGCDGLSGKGQAWVRQGILAATVVTPPLTGTALEMLGTALRSHAQPPEQTFVPPKSFPALEELRGLHFEKHA